jgi:hypothetical protein
MRTAKLPSLSSLRALLLGGALLLTAAACGDDADDGGPQGVDQDVTGKGRATSTSGKVFAAVCDERSGDNDSCDEYFSDDPKFRIPYTVGCKTPKVRCPPAKFGTCVSSPKKQGVDPFDLYEHYYAALDNLEKRCTDAGGTWPKP